MEKVELKKVELKATDYDKYVFDFIINRFNFYDNYYGNFTQILPELTYKEFTTLKDDFIEFKESSLCIGKNIDVKTVQSFKRSCQLMKGKIDNGHSKSRKEFVIFLEYCIQNLDTMVDRLIDEILAQLS